MSLVINKGVYEECVGGSECGSQTRGNITFFSGIMEGVTEKKIYLVF